MKRLLIVVLVVVCTSVGHARYISEPARGFAGIVNVKDYGAKGDGVTDDTVAIQNAIAVVPAAGGIVFFPAGTYRVTSTLTINRKRALTLVGSGRGETAAGAILKANITAPLLHIAQRGNTAFEIAIKSLVLFQEGSGETIKVGPGSNADITFENIYATNAGSGTTILFDSTVDTEIYRSSIRVQHGGKAIDFLASAASPTTFSLRKTQLQGMNSTTGIAIDLTGVSGAHLKDVIIQNAKKGLVVGSVGDSTFLGIHTENVATALELGPGAVRNAFIGNNFNGNLVMLENTTGNVRNQFLSNRNIGDRIYHEVVAGASLPAGHASRDGEILIEDNGPDDRNLIFYAGGQRFRINAGKAF